MQPKHNRFEAYTVTLLENKGHYLLLQRSTAKCFAPGLWTGVGGRVERSEYDDLQASALRELCEETGIEPDAVTPLVLRRALLHNRPGSALTLLLYYTARLAARQTPFCPEGMLSWLSPSMFDKIEIIETTRPVLPLLVEDMRRDPEGLEDVRLGIAVFRLGKFSRPIWGAGDHKE